MTTTLICAATATIMAETNVASLAAVSREVSRLLDAMEIVESGGNPNAVGDGGRSLGPLQIQRAYWLDSRMPGHYRMVKMRRYARETVLAYWRRYCRNALADGNLEWLARVHNGGQHGPLLGATKGYWHKVKAVLRRMGER